MDQTIIDMVEAAETAVTKAMEALKGVSQNSTEVAKLTKRLEQSRLKIYQEKLGLLHNLYQIDCLLRRRTPMNVSEFLRSGKLLTYRREEFVKDLLAYPFYWQACRELTASISEKLPDVKSGTDADRKHAAQIIPDLARLLEQVRSLAPVVPVGTQK